MNEVNSLRNDKISSHNFLYPILHVFDHTLIFNFHFFQLSLIVRIDPIKTKLKLWHFWSLIN